LKTGDSIASTILWAWEISPSTMIFCVLDVDQINGKLIRSGEVSPCSAVAGTTLFFEGDRQEIYQA
jgi:hypothetical protein